MSANLAVQECSSHRSSAHLLGTYSVNSDCTTGTVSFATGVGFTMSIVVTDGGQEIKYVDANTGNINSGTLRLMAATWHPGRRNVTGTKIKEVVDDIIDLLEYAKDFSQNT
jgi:hypothetical protein